VDESSVGFEFASSSGPGGQNVNKRATKARLRVPLSALHLPPGALSRLRGLAGGQITESGELLITAESHRSQRGNKEEALSRLSELVRAACVKPKSRKPTAPTRGSVERRLGSKKRRSDLKSRRQGEADG
jgi:ribosome-associated protein